MDNENMGVEEVEVAQPQEETDVTSEVVENAVETVENTTEVTAKPQQSAEENAKFADNRRKKELEDTKAELETLRSQNKQATQALGLFFEGDDISTLSDQARAKAEGRNLQEVTQERVKTEQENAHINELEQENEKYRRKEIENALDNGLKEIQKVDSTVKTLDDLGPDFFDLMVAGVKPEQAYYAIKQTKPKTKVPTTGTINSSKIDVPKDKYAAMSDEEYAREYHKVVFGE
jgi:hypothetical protein